MGQNNKLHEGEDSPRAVMLAVCSPVRMVKKKKRETKERCRKLVGGEEERERRMGGVKGHFNIYFYYNNDSHQLRPKSIWTTIAST